MAKEKTETRHWRNIPNAQRRRKICDAHNKRQTTPAKIHVAESVVNKLEFFVYLDSLRISNSFTLKLVVEYLFFLRLDKL